MASCKAFNCKRRTEAVVMVSKNITSGSDVEFPVHPSKSCVKSCSVERVPIAGSLAMQDLTVFLGTQLALDAAAMNCVLSACA